ncbi:HTTM domain-containing protein [Ilumatobacter sp.]|uniref:HTTM domain-containing protein n=1 Tax=Ilumatobacter sp. TaxID=1967498 RepID=UPI003B51B610
MSEVRERAHGEDRGPRSGAFGRVVSAVVDRRGSARGLAALRVVVATFTAIYLATRVPVHLALGDRRAEDFDPVGLATLLPGPVARPVLVATVVTTLVAWTAVVIGFAHRLSGPVAALGLLALATYRSSWGQLLHFEHLIVLHGLVLAVSPAADAWSLDARRRGAAARRERPSSAYGFPLGVAAAITAVTYVVAGIAKLRLGGADWVVGDVLRNHVAYSAARLDVLGADPPVLARSLVRVPVLLSVAAAVSLAIELAAPVALLGGRVRDTWVAAAWAMHVGILAAMHVGFPSPLFGVAFAPLFDLERGARVAWSALRRARGRLTPTTGP